MKLGKAKLIITLNILLDNKSNMKMLWSRICSIINVKSNVGISIANLDQNGVKIEEPKRMADIFNNVFVNTAHEKIPTPENNH